MTAVTLPARQLILDLLATLRRGTMPVGALVEAGGLFGIPDGAVRVALARLLTAEEVARDERGRYRLGVGAAALERRVRSWRDLDRATRAWDGGWLAVHHAPSPAAQRRHHGRGREKALRLLGFKAFDTTLALRPDNLRADVHQVRDELHALGLPAGDLVATLRNLDPVSDTRARSLWDVVRLRRGYVQHLRDLAASTERLATLPVERAMVESFLLGRGVIHDLVLDPLLPDDVCPVAPRHELLAALRRYDRLGRSAWADFLRRFDVPHIRTPLDGGLGLESHRLAV